MNGMDYLKAILDVRDPWKVVDVHVDNGKQQLDIYLGFDEEEVKKNFFGASAKKFLFGRGKPPICPDCKTVLPTRSEYKTLRSQHLPVAGLKTYLHFPPPDAVKSDKQGCICQQSWVAPGLNCTPAMRDQAVSVLQVVAATGIASKLLGLPESELKEIVKSLQLVTDTAVGEAERIGVDASGIPQVDHPVWPLLIRGEMLLNTKSVPLRMLLQRARRSSAAAPGPDALRQGAEALVKFFQRNKKILEAEIQQLASPQLAVDGPQAVSAPPEQDSAIPQESDNVWKELIYGDLRLQTSMVGLQMLIEKARASIGQDASEANMKDLTANLRQFFIKHQRRLKTEIELLRSGRGTAGAGVAKTDAGTSEYPETSHPVWVQLIRGEKKLPQDILSLNMLLQRSRRALGQEPSEERALEEADKVRNFLMTYKRITAQDLQQIM